MALEEKDDRRSDGTTPMPRSTCSAAMGLAVADRQPLPPGSEFGWSLDPGDDSQGLVPLADLLTESGIRWVKFPFVCSPHQDNELAEKPRPTRRNSTRPALPAKPDAVEPLINFNHRLARAGVQMAGVLLSPREPGGASTALLAAEAFARDPKVWFPSIEPILARLGTEIRCWQIGDDRDASWIGCGEFGGRFASQGRAGPDRTGPGCRNRMGPRGTAAGGTRAAAECPGRR